MSEEQPNEPPPSMWYVDGDWHVTSLMHDYSGDNMYRVCVRHSHADDIVIDLRFDCFVVGGEW